jgi:hypothetical protein
MRDGKVGLQVSIKEIEAAILQLPNRQLSELTEWLLDYRAKSWDNEIEKDLEDGRLDNYLDEIDAEYNAGLASFL